MFPQIWVIKQMLLVPQRKGRSINFFSWTLRELGPILGHVWLGEDRIGGTGE